MAARFMHGRALMKMTDSSTGHVCCLPDKAAIYAPTLAER